MTLFDSLAQKKRFRTSVFKIFEGIMNDFSPTKREQEKLDKIVKEEKKKEESAEEDEDQVPISSTFYVQIFCTNVVSAMLFLCTCN